MREYNYLDIKKIDKTGILFSDGEFIGFEICKYEWAREKNISGEASVCIASRFAEGDDRYFIFYGKEKIKLSFVFKGIFRNKKSRKKFLEMQVLLNSYGYTSYDMS